MMPLMPRAASALPSIREACQIAGADHGYSRRHPLIDPVHRWRRLRRRRRQGRRRRSGLVIVSKDTDFRERSYVEGFPPKVIWLDVGNAGRRAIADSRT